MTKDDENNKIITKAMVYGKASQTAENLGWFFQSRRCAHRVNDHLFERHTVRVTVYPDNHRLSDLTMLVTPVVLY